jgi:GNAT superfamily N-acetyltransferase
MYTSLRTTTATGRIRILRLQPAHAEPLLAMLRRCSRATLYHRFHGVTDGVSYVLKVLESCPRTDSYAAWSADRCVGLASIHALDPDTADLGVLVEDAWQRRGVGTALVGASVRRARELALRSLRADILAERQFIVPLLAQIGPIRTTLGRDGYSVLVNLDAERGAVSSTFSQSSAGDGTPQRVWLPRTSGTSWQPVTAGGVR